MDSSGSGGGIAATLVFVIYLAILVLVVVSSWKVFVKAGKPGWAAIVPIYNLVVLLQICDKPIWWVILLLLPLVNIVVGILLCIALAQVFGKGVGFAIGILLLGFVFLPILAFGDAQYQGVTAAAG
jgi:hypothetical protein